MKIGFHNTGGGTFSYVVLDEDVYYKFKYMQPFESVQVMVLDYRIKPPSLEMVDDSKFHD